MSPNECPDPETLAVFALGQSSGEAWRRVVRHLADCALCRRQVALVAETGDAALPPGEPVRLLPLPERTRTWQRVAQGIAAAALVAAGTAWAFVHRPVPTVPKEAAAPSVRPKSAPEKPIAPAPAPPEPVFAQPQKRPASPPEHFIPRPAPTPEKPTPDIVEAPPPSPFLAERATSLVAEAIEVTAGQGSVSRRSGEIVTPLLSKTILQPSDTLLSPAGGSVTLPDGATVHLGRESELRLSWSQTLACATVDVRKGDAVVDLGRTARPLYVAHGPLGVHLGDSAGLLLVSAGEQSLRAMPLSGAAQFPTRGGGARRLGPLQSLVLGQAGDSLESIEKADISVFPTLESKGRAAPPPPPPSEKKPPLLDVLLTGLGQQSYAYRVSGRQVREGVWSPAGFFTSTVEEFTAVKRGDDKEASHLRRGSRPWDDLGKVAPASRDARLVEIVRSSQAPHQMVLEILGTVRGESAQRTDKIRDRICVSWDLTMDPSSLRPFMEKILDAAVAEGRLERPDAVYWESLEGSLECAALKFDSKILRVIDRRKVSYSYKTVGGLERRTYHLETVYEFFSHGAAAMPLPPEMIRELSSSKK